MQTEISESDVGPQELHFYLAPSPTTPATRNVDVLSLDHTVNSKGITHYSS